MATDHWNRKKRPKLHPKLLPSIVDKDDVSPSSLLLLSSSSIVDPPSTSSFGFRESLPSLTDVRVEYCEATASSSPGSSLLSLPCSSPLLLPADLMATAAALAGNLLLPCDDEGYSDVPWTFDAKSSNPNEVHINPASQTNSARQSPTMEEAKCASLVKTLSPTLGGIVEAARVFRSAVSSLKRKRSLIEMPTGEAEAAALLSFPTETVYAAACCVKVGKGVDHYAPLPPFECLFRCTTAASAGHIYPQHAANPATAPPRLFVCDASHAENYADFGRPKTFALKPPSTAAPHSTAPRLLPPPTTKFNMLRAASFSESREAFVRLASKFWPGPVVIYVKARTVTAAGGDGEKENTGGKGSNDRVEKNSANGEGCGAHEDDVAPPRSSISSSSSWDSFNSPDVELGPPALPREAILSTPLLIPGDTEHVADFIGMRCPSHPLARRLLAETYRGSLLPRSNDGVSSANSRTTNDNKKFPSKKSAPRDHRRPRWNVAVVGRDLLAATTAERASDETSSFLLQRHCCVLDGEDYAREHFAVPTCQYGAPHPVSLLVDGERRMVHLLRSGGQKKTNNDDEDEHCDPRRKEDEGEKRVDDQERAERVGGGERQHHCREDDANPSSHVAIKSCDVRRALLLQSDNQSSDKDRSEGNIERVISAVLRRWHVEERHV